MGSLDAECNYVVRGVSHASMRMDVFLANNLDIGEVLIESMFIEPKCII